MDDSAFDLVITPAKNAVQVRVPLAKAITTIGSGPTADIKLQTVSEEWAVVRRDGSGIVVRIAGQDAVSLAVGESMSHGEQELALESRKVAALDMEALATTLTAASSPSEALHSILAGSIDGAGADSGAIITMEDGSYQVAAARDKQGNVLETAADLLSDTIVRDVLGSGQQVQLTDVGSNEKYRALPSVVSLKLESVLCLPMRIEGKTLGALFLGKRNKLASFGEQVTAELKVLTQMAVPFLAKMRPGQAAARDNIIGESKAIEELRELVRRVAPSDLSVVIHGPSGSGKELVAQAIHRSSPRADKALIALNCASVPESLLSAELFGYKRGAFTGAHADRKGVIEAADGSTLFLDEVGDMPLAMQASLLRVLEQREVKRLGETDARPVDFRLIAATHRDLKEEVAAGRFREDLMFRLDEMTVALPSLAERGDDVLLLSHFFLRQAEKSLSLPMHVLTDECLQALRAHHWPGNVRELRATMRRAAILADTREVTPANLRLGPARETKTAAQLGDLGRSLADARDDFVMRYVHAVVERHDGNRESAAQALDIGVRTLYRYLS